MKMHCIRLFETLGTEKQSYFPDDDNDGGHTLERGLQRCYGHSVGGVFRGGVLLSECLKQLVVEDC